MYLRRTRLRSRLFSDWDDRNCHGGSQCSIHRRQLLAARALNERSLLIRGLPFPRTKTIGLVILSVLPNVHVDSSPTEVQRAVKCGQVMQYTRERVWVRTPGRRSRHAPIPSCTPTSAHAHLVVAVGVNRTLFALAFRREVSASLGVSYTALCRQAEDAE